MFWSKKKEKKTLDIKLKDVFSIIKSDYDEGIAFCLIEFMLDDEMYTMGSVLTPNSDEIQENIYFIFNDDRYDTYDEFAENVEINGVKLSNSDEVITIVRAGIIDGDAMINTPWGDTRLAKMAIEK